MKKFLLCLLVLVFAVLLCSAEENVFQEGDYIFRIENNEAILVEWCGSLEGGKQEILYIPSVLGGVPLKRIGELALSGRLNETPVNDCSIYIPEGVVSLDDSSFEVTNAKTIYLPSTIENISEGSFLFSDAEIIFPNGNPYYEVKDGFLIDLRSSALIHAGASSYEFPLPAVKRLGNGSITNWLMEQGSQVNEISLPDSLESIGSLVFYDLPDLKRIVLPNRVSQIDEGAFFSVPIQELVLPASLKDIPAYCFNNCELSGVTIPNGVRSIGEHAFCSMWIIMEEVTLPETVEFVGYHAFDDETSIYALNPQTHFETYEEYLLRDNELIIAWISENYELSDYHCVKALELENRSILFRYDKKDANHVGINVDQFDGTPDDSMRLFIYDPKEKQVFEIE